MFVNRSRELAALGRVLGPERPALFVLYGRRRVGKTDLLKHFYAERSHLYYLGDLGSPAVHVKSLASRLGQHLGDDYLRSAEIAGWRDLLEYLRIGRRPLDLILDEFPYLVEAEPALPSLLKGAWDEGLKESLRLTLCGSSVGFMEREVLAERSPLFGRRTGQMRLRPMSFWDARGFLSGFSPIDQLVAYACLGGVPAYLEKVDSRLSLFENLLAGVLDPVSYLYEEPRLLLHQELREPRHYYAILRSLAAGCTRLNEIAQDAALPNTLVGRYLDTLRHLELVQRMVPANEPHPDRSRKGLYQIADPFFRFWFRFVLPNLSELELGRSQAVLQRQVAPNLNHFVAPIFEEVCQEWVRRTTQLPFRPQRVGRWWDRQTEIDLLAYDDHHVLYGECKWTDRPMRGADLGHLQKQSARVAGFEGRQAYYALFSRSGFEPALLEEPGLLCVGLDRLLEPP